MVGGARAAVVRPPRLRGVVVERDGGAPVPRLRQQLHRQIPVPARGVSGPARRPDQRPLLQEHEADQTELEDAPLPPLPQVVARALLDHVGLSLRAPPLPPAPSPPCRDGRRAGASERKGGRETEGETGEEKREGARATRTLPLISS